MDPQMQMVYPEQIVMDHERRVCRVFVDNPYGSWQLREGYVTLNSGWRLEVCKRMKIYIACSDFLKAFGLAQVIESRTTHKVVSRWIQGAMHQPTRRYSDSEKSTRVDVNMADIDSADMVILITDYDPVPGGKWIDFGYAMKAGKKLVILGGRHENSYTYHTSIIHAESVEALIAVLSAQS